MPTSRALGGVACALVLAACSLENLDSLRSGSADASVDGGSGGSAGASGTTATGGAAGSDGGPAGAGGVDNCGAGRADCNANPEDGCETNLLTSLANCGGCGSPCAYPHATAACDNGTCMLAACATGYADCDGDKVDGCEKNLDADPMNCSTCGHICPPGSTSGVCNAGVCGTSPCAPGTGDCDGDPSNGCEANLHTDAANCGFCGNGCQFAHASASCSAAKCVLGTCSAGYMNCDGNDGNGCESQPATDAKNCGACGHDCLGGACQNGACQAITLASGLGDPTGIAVDANNVYVTAENAGTVSLIPKDGGAVVTLASGQTKPFGVAVDSTYVYFTGRVDTGGTVSRVPIAGGSVKVLVTGQVRPANIAVDATYVYWTNSLGAALLRAPIGGGSATTIGSSIGGILGLAIDASHAYYSTDSTAQGEVGYVPLDGSAGKTVLASSQPDPRTMVMAGSYLYWANYTDGSIARVLKTGGTVATLATDGVNPQAITADATDAYYGDYTNPGSVRRVPAAGGSSTVIATGQARPRRMANDATAVYWTNDQGGQVMKIAK